MKNNKLVIASAISVTAMISGCAATQTALEHRKLVTETKMSKSIFLEPVEQRDKKVFISVKNTTDKDLDIRRQLAKSISSNGYQVVTTPSKAHYLLQANILQVGKVDKNDLNKLRLGGYGSQINGAVAGIATAAYLSSSSRDIYGAGLIGAGASMVADSLVKDVTYGMITDVQISERLSKDVDSKQVESSNLSQGAGSKLEQRISRKTKWQKYQTRVVSSADKVNLTFAEARLALEKGLVKNLAGLF